MTLRSSVVPAALALAGCFPSESEPPPQVEQVTYHTPVEGGACEVEDVVYHLHAELYQGVAYGKSALRSSSLVVTVAESQSVVDCQEDIVRISTPGAELTTATFATSDNFDLDVPAVVIGGQRPSIWVRALIDTNANGLCDDGELVGTAQLEADDLGDFSIELRDDEGCPTRS